MSNLQADLLGARGFAEQSKIRILLWRIDAALAALRTQGGETARGCRAAPRD